MTVKTNAAENSGEEPSFRWKKILAPTDFSAPAKLALQEAAGLAERCGAKITLLHVVQLPAASPVEAPIDVDEIMDSARASLDAMAGEISAELISGKIARLGARDTVQEITEAAREISADLIVIATRGHNHLKQLLLGGTAEHVVRHAPCPVLVVRKKQDVSQANAEASVNPFRKTEV